MDEITLVLQPAPDVTDMDEWYASLEQVAPVRTDPGWASEGAGVRARLPTPEALSLAQQVRNTLGDSVVVRTQAAFVAAVDIATGQPTSPPTDVEEELDPG